MERHSAVTYVVLGLLAAVAIMAIATNVLVIGGTGSAEKVQELSIVGTAKEAVVPDRVRITLGVETLAKTADEASRENARLMASVVDALRGVGISDKEMSTSAYSIYPVYDENYVNIVGFVVLNMLTVDTDKLEAIGRIIDASVHAGANRIYGLQIYVSDAKVRELRSELLREAVEDARAKAEELLTPLGLKVVGVKTASIIEEGRPIIYRDVPMLKEALTPIMPGEATVSIGVQVTFLIG